MIEPGNVAKPWWSSIIGVDGGLLAALFFFSASAAYIEGTEMLDHALLYGEFRLTS